jgi:hypothetical protein
MGQHARHACCNIQFDAGHEVVPQLPAGCATVPQAVAIVAEMCGVRIMQYVVLCRTFVVNRERMQLNHQGWWLLLLLQYQGAYVGRAQAELLAV